jgi:two-component sensor histidine kinase
MPRRLRPTKLARRQQGFKVWFCVMKAAASTSDRDQDGVLESVDCSRRRPAVPPSALAGESMPRPHAAHLVSLFDAGLASLRRAIVPGSVQAYAFALVCVCAATLFESLLLSFEPEASKLIAYYPAIALAALFGGVGPGLLVAAVAGLTAWWFLLPPVFSFALLRHGDTVTLVTFGFAALLMVFAADHFRRFAQRLENEEQLRQLAVQELAHRLKNKIATIQAIISVQLRDQPQLRKDILDRLGALTAADQLIEDANGRGALVRDIAETELGPYIASRVTLEGPSVLLPPKYALTIALLIHELATNSAKYGSLSVPDGRVLLRSAVTDAVLRLEWRERNGPRVTAPRHRGFGLLLLSRALKPFDGGAELVFEPAGLVCTMTLTLPAGTTGRAADEPAGPRTATSA